MNATLQQQANGNGNPPVESLVIDLGGEAEQQAATTDAAAQPIEGELSADEASAARAVLDQAREEAAAEPAAANTETAAENQTQQPAATQTDPAAAVSAGITPPVIMHSVAELPIGQALSSLGSGMLRQLTSLVYPPENLASSALSAAAMFALAATLPYAGPVVIPTMVLSGFALSGIKALEAFWYSGLPGTEGHKRAICSHFGEAVADAALTIASGGAYMPMVCARKLGLPGILRGLFSRGAAANPAPGQQQQPQTAAAAEAEAPIVAELVEDGPRPVAAATPPPLEARVLEESAQAAHAAEVASDDHPMGDFTIHTFQPREELGDAPTPAAVEAEAAPSTENLLEDYAIDTFQAQPALIDTSTEGDVRPSTRNTRRIAGEI